MTTASTPPGGPGVTEQNSEPQPIDGARALQLLREVVAERPDYVYRPPNAASDDAMEPCVYQHGGQPSCVVGHVLVRAGRPITALTVLDDEGVSASMLNSFDGTIEEIAADILREAQRIQDRAWFRHDDTATWGAALASAERYASEHGVSA
jgi:hypothetical protein